jgi:hypothetical protein
MTRERTAVAESPKSCATAAQRTTHTAGVSLSFLAHVKYCPHTGNGYVARTFSALFGFIEAAGGT